MYTREHYEDIARILGEQRAEITASNADEYIVPMRLALSAVELALVSRFAADNVNFSGARFRARIMEVEHAPQDR
jgi:hypothetical protein